MKKVDNFNAGKWLVENKITTQSKLNEEVSDDVENYLNELFESYLEGGDSFEEEPGETHVFTMEEDDERYKDDYLFNKAINQLQNSPIVLDYNKDYTGDYGKVTVKAGIKTISISFIVPEELNEGQAKKMIEVLDEDSPVETKLIKKGTKFKNNFNGKILTVAKDFEVTLPIDKKSGRKFVMIYSPEYESGYNPSGIERMSLGSLFRGGTQID